ncbi:hypothetical protein HD554DRAFT_2297344 [Boletus coccyginus]|nr:hypothetical protein HD554DRAFT_2297344 [Boletus coccyginus]
MAAPLDKLERLVVMRLFELSKLSLSGTAIQRYNALAATLSPPRPPVSWKDITKYSFLGEFDLLRHSRTDVREHEWAKPAIREATTKYFKLCRAKEEIIWLDVEMRRLRTAIHDEEMKVSDAIAKLLETDPPLGRELQCLHRARAAVNCLARDMDDLYDLYINDPWR